MIDILLFFIGSAMGSTIGAFLYRRKNITSFILDRSRCETCNKVIPFYLNIPIFSYVFLRGKCKFCKCEISSINILYEIVTGTVFLLLYKKIGFNIKFLIRLIEVILILIISFTDIREHKIYTLDLLLLFILEIIYKVFIENVRIEPFIVMGIVFIIYYLIFKITNAIGEGDIYFAMVCSFFSNNYMEGFKIFRNSFIIASVFSIFFILLKYKNRKDEIAFCPYIAISLFMVIL